MKYNCNICKTLTNHEILFNNDNKDDNDSFYKEYQVIKCCGCDTVSFRHTYRKPFDWDSDGNIKPTEVFFPPQQLRELVDIYWLPINIKKIYREAHLATRNCLRILAGVAIRAIVEEICTDKGIIKGNLNSKIINLKEKGIITEEQEKALHIQRLFGNQSAHNLYEMSDGELTACLDIIDIILESIYIMPKRKARANSLLNKIKR